MTYDFDAPVNRLGTDCEKWDDTEDMFGKAGLLPFWVADMDFKAAPEILDALHKRADEGVFGYHKFTERAREAAANWQRTRHGWDVSAKDVGGFTPGVIIGLISAVLEFTEPGDEIIIQTPVYPQFFNIVKLNNRIVAENHLIETEDGWRIDFEGFEKLITRQGSKVKMLIMCSPHNPVARVWRKDELLRLAEICARRGIIVLSDDIHQDIVYSDAKHMPIGSVAPEIEPFLVTFVAPSKTFNMAGLYASAWIARDAKMRSRMRKASKALHAHSVSAVGMVGLETAYEKCAPWCDQLVTYLEKSRAFVENFLKERTPRIKLRHPEGTYVFWLDFRDYGLGNKELQRVLVEDAGVALNAGINFGAEGDGFARLNIGCPKSQLEEGLTRIESAFTKR
ncbi:cystathionine beta-lyase PatB [Synergistales bacterium]|nr:cystathionine beta-lyase PatB [Synergistales bacterium]